jgi:ABC transporter substrate binding protein (PQQ-dependent alcohol dehydrogenase system)
MNALIRALLLLAVTFLSHTPAFAERLDVVIGYLRVLRPTAAISLVEAPSRNDGLAGAQLAIDDNNTTGRFLDHHYSVEEARLRDDADPAAVAAAVTAFADKGVKFVVADLPARILLAAADAAQSRGILLFNAGAPDENLREQDCRANVIHTAPSRAMLADALGQYLVWKTWRQWFLVVGSHEADRLWADALRRAAQRFGAKIVGEKVFEDTGGARRTDSGLAQIQRQIPVFTQGLPAHDVLVAADESDVFAPYLPFRTWSARPVAGSAGLVPASWHGSHDQWGAIQLQNRFADKFGRRMSARDMQAWSAVRIVGEGTTRTRTGDPAKIREFVRGPTFSLAAFKGQRLTLRDWNQQLRQPILLSDGRVVVSVSPQEGFLHAASELDTLGYDRPETKCSLK